MKLMHLPNNYLNLFYLTIGSKLYLWTIAFILTIFFDVNYLNWNNGWEGVLKCFYNFDSGWYKLIAENGHHKITSDQLYSIYKPWEHQSYYAFFPLYPFLTYIFSNIFRDWFLGAFILQFLLSTTGFILFYELSKIIFSNRKSAFYATLCLIFFPFHFYFSVFYTESLFLTLLAGCYLALYHQKWIWWWVLSGLLVLSRPNGVILCLPLFLYFIEKTYQYKSFNDLIKNKLWNNFELKWFNFLAPIIVFLAYCFYLKEMTGDFLAFSTAQKGWQRSWNFPWTSFFNSGSFAAQFNSIFGILAILLGIYINFQRKLEFTFSWQILFWISLLLPLCTGSIQSLPRIMSICFPFIWIIYIILSQKKEKIPLIILAILLLSQGVMFLAWLNSAEYAM